MNIVVGSGPAGVAASLALIEKGQPVTMIDGGSVLELERQRVLDHLKSQTASQWSAAELDLLQGDAIVNTDGIQLKLAYGSDYPIRGSRDFLTSGSEVYSKLISLAQGGLSSVWGGAVLPYSEQDLEEWPIPLKELEPHYRRIVDFIGVSARHDELERLFPLYSKTVKSLSLSRQAELLMRDLERHRSSLAKNNLFFGAARLSVDTNVSGQGLGCVYCGRCLYGCPYELIYNSFQSLRILQENPLFQYRSGIIIDKVTEVDSSATLEGHLSESGQPVTLTASRIFLACGVISSGRIMLRSLKSPAHELKVKTSQHFIIPLLRFKSVNGVQSEKLHTLSQLFLEYVDPLSGENNTHYQVYTFSDFVLRALQSALGRFLKPLWNTLLAGRLLIVQGYLHSGRSPHLKLTFNSETDKLSVQTEVNLQTRVQVWKAAWRLCRSVRQFRAIPLVPLLRISEPGGGAHLGGTFPMREKPGPLESDLLGRPTGYRRLHLVDASTFCSVPPTTITLTIMANAYRIATQASND